MKLPWESYSTDEGDGVGIGGEEVSTDGDPQRSQVGGFSLAIVRPKFPVSHY